jgi:hypothetical protein
LTVDSGITGLCERRGKRCKRHLVESVRRDGERKKRTRDSLCPDHFFAVCAAFPDVMLV